MRISRTRERKKAIIFGMEPSESSGDEEDSSLRRGSQIDAQAGRNVSTKKRDAVSSKRNAAAANPTVARIARPRTPEAAPTPSSGPKFRCNRHRKAAKIFGAESPSSSESSCNESVTPPSLPLPVCQPMQRRGGRRGGKQQPSQSNEQPSGNPDVKQPVGSKQSTGDALRVAPEAAPTPSSGPKFRCNRHRKAAKIFGAESPSSSESSCNESVTPPSLPLPVCQPMQRRGGRRGGKQQPSQSNEQPSGNPDVKQPAGSTQSTGSGNPDVKQPAGSAQSTGDTTRVAPEATPTPSSGPKFRCNRHRKAAKIFGAESPSSSESSCNESVTPPSLPLPVCQPMQRRGGRRGGKQQPSQSNEQPSGNPDVKGADLPNDVVVVHPAVSVEMEASGRGRGKARKRQRSPSPEMSATVHATVESAEVPLITSCAAIIGDCPATDPTEPSLPVAPPQGDGVPVQPITAVFPTIVPCVSCYSLHYYHTVGVPFFFTNGTAGIWFLDGSCMLLEPNNRLIYVNRHRHRFVIASGTAGIIAVPRRLERKVFAVLWCRERLREERKGLVQCAGGAGRTHVVTHTLPGVPICLWDPTSTSQGEGDDFPFVAHVSCPPRVASSSGDDNKGANEDETPIAVPAFVVANRSVRYPDGIYYCSDEDGSE